MNKITGNKKIVFDEKITYNLQYNSNNAYGTKVHELLLAAVGLAVKEITKQSKLHVSVESYGRQEINGNMQVDRTVGWFTNAYPVCLNMPYDELGKNIISVKETMRQVPNEGIGYGVLLLGNTDRFSTEKPDIGFNYFGVIKNSGEEFNSGIKYSELDTGLNIADENGAVTNDILFDGMIIKKRLKFDIYYNKTKFDDDFVEKLKLNFESVLNNIIKHCTEQTNRVITPSDYNIYDLSYEEFQSILQKYGSENIEKVYELSPMQEGMLYHKLKDNSSTSYLIQIDWRLTGEYNIPILKQAIQKLSKQYEVFRTAIVYSKISNAKQIVLRDRSIEIIEHDLIHTSQHDRENVIDLIKSNDLKRGFDIQNDSLMRMYLIQEDLNNIRIIWSFHHIILDGWCLNIVKNTLMDNYKFLSSAPQKIEDKFLSPFKYDMYIDWLRKQNIEKSIEYFLNKLEGYDNIIGLPSINTHPSNKRNIQEIYSQEPVDFLNNLENFAKKHSITVNTIIETAIGIVLQKYNNTDDVVFGKVVSGRNVILDGIEDGVGLFVNTIPTRVLSGNKTTVLDLLRLVQNNSIESSTYEHCSLAEIQNAMPQKEKLINILYVFENYHFENNNNDNLQIVAYREEVNYDILITSGYMNNKLYYKIAYNSGIYSEEEISLFLGRIKKLLRNMLIDPELLVSEICIIDNAEIEELKRVSLITKEYDFNRSIIELFEERAEEFPMSTAVFSNDKSITYQELSYKADQLAKQIINLGVNENDFVGILIDRSIEMIIALLGILKAGAAYVPIDTELPTKRKEYIIEDSGINVLITNNDAVNDLRISDNVKKVYVDQIKDNNEESKSIVASYHMDDAMYMIYTSGSTGKPKGVIVENRTLLNLLAWENEELNIMPHDNVLWSTSISFDVATQEILTTLVSGATGFLISSEQKKDKNMMTKYIEDNEINVVFTTPSYFSALTSDENSTKIICRNFNKVILAGEKFFINDNVRSCGLAQNISFYNNYGPTETHVVTSKVYNVNDLVSNSIGKPISNTHIYIINKGVLCGIGIIGEICVAGTPVARGYLNRNDLNEEKFRENPFGDGKLYYTGDIGKWLDNGEIEYLGRKDDQLKIRGFRVELGEIENEIRKSNDEIIDVAVVAKGENDKRICAYIVSHEEIDLKQLRVDLMENLPDYMIPLMLQVEKIPLTSNGKVDKSKLPDLVAESVTQRIKPRTELEKRLCTLFSDVLEVNELGIDDNFFEFGGHSLKVMNLINNIERDFGVRLPFNSIFKFPTVEKLAKTIENEKGEKYKEFNKAEEKKYYSMTPSQKRMFFINKFDKDSLTYNMPIIYKFNKNSLSIEKVTDVFEKLVFRHEILRTKFCVINGEPVQQILENVKLDIEEIVCDKFQLNNFIYPFNLEAPPLFRVKIIKSKEESNDLLLLDIHHIISDGRSCEILFDEFNKLFNGETLNETPLQYKDYSEQINSKQLLKEDEYWTAIVSGDLPRLELPLDFVRPKVQSNKGSTISTFISNELKQKIEKLAFANRTTEYMVLSSAVMILLHRYSRQNDILIGTPVSGRTHKDTENILGLFVNTIVLKASFDNNERYDEFIKKFSQNTLEAFDNQDYPFDKMVELCESKRDLSRNPIFDVMFSYRETEDAAANVEENAMQITHFDLSIAITKTPNGYLLGGEYCTDLFREDSITRMLQRLIKILDIISSDSKIEIDKIDILDSEEKNMIINEFNDTDVPYPQNKTISQIFEENVAKYSDRKAIIYQNQSLTYLEMNNKANNLACFLTRKGVKQGDCIALTAERKIESIVAMLAILKVGATYVPIEPNYPQKRIDYMLEDSKCVGILWVEEELNVSVPIWKENLRNIENGNDYEGVFYSASPLDMAYIIYTSGTTGIPKGVMISQRNIIKLVKNVDYFDFDQIRLLQTCELVFDVSTFEIWGTLLNGGCLNLIDKEDLFHANIVKDIIKENKIDTAFFSVALFNQLLLEDITVFDSLKNVWSGGEALSVEHVNLLRKHNNTIRIFNGYGPTENTTFTTSYEIKKELDIIPIGKPLTNTKVYVLDKNDMLCGIGIPGEICTTGEGLAEGYLNKEDLTNQKFVVNPFGKGKMYRTGDLGRWTPDGNVEFLGRIDQQVKIRGFRIELGEIENAIRKIENVKDATVIVKGENSDKKLCAYITSNQLLDLEYIKNKLSESLPEYMIPLMMQIDKMPMNASGKIDKNSLPNISIVRKSDFIKPRNDEEKVIVQVFKDVLKADNVGATDDFFELGGDSIKAISIAGKLKDCGYNIEIKKILMLKTVEALADYFMKNKTEDVPIENTKKLHNMDTKNDEERNNWHYCLCSKEFKKNIVEKILQQVLLNYKLAFSELISYNINTEEIDENENQLNSYVEDALKSVNCNTSGVNVTIMKEKTKQYLLLVIVNAKMDSYSFARFIDDFVDAYMQYLLNGNTIFTSIPTFTCWENVIQKIEKISTIGGNQEKSILKNLMSENYNISEHRANNMEVSNKEISNLDRFLEWPENSFGQSIDALLVAAISLTLHKETSTSIVPMWIKNVHRNYLKLDTVVDDEIGNLSREFPIGLEVNENILEHFNSTKLYLSSLIDHTIEFIRLKSADCLETSSKIPSYRCINEHDIRLRKTLGKDKLIHGVSIPILEKTEEYDHELNFCPQILGDKLLFTVIYNSDYNGKEDIDNMLNEICHNINLIIHNIEINRRDYIRKVKHMLLSGSELYNASLKSEEKEAFYTPTNLQNYFLRENNYIILNVKLPKTYKLSCIQTAINEIIKQHSVLRTGFNGEYLIEYSKKTEWSIPILNLATETSNNVIYDLMNEILKNNRYLENRLINNLYLIEGEEEYELFGYIHHAIWDSMSTVNFEEFLFALLKNNSSLSLDTYSNHIKRIRDAAGYSTILSIEEKDMIESLKEFISGYDENTPINFTYVRLNLSEKEKAEIKNKPISFSYQLLLECLKDNSKTIPTNFPVSVLFHGRNKENEKKLGLYLVLLPINTMGVQGTLENYYGSIRKEIDIYRANYFSELLFEYLEEKIIIPPYINFKNIFEISDNKQDTINLPRINHHSSTRLDGTVGIEIMVLKHNVHILFPVYEKDIKKIESSIERAYDSIIQ